MTIAFDFTGQTVLITGAATGLGFATAEVFGQAGVSLALNDLTPERVEHASARLAVQNVECRDFPADVRDAAAVRRMVDDACAAYGPPDVLVANAGIYPNTPFLDLTEEEWDRVLDTNLKGIFLTCQAVARAMIAADRPGRIVTVSSGAANTAYHGWSHYCVSKAGVVTLTRAMALELGPRGIRVNAVLPGYIDVEEGGVGLAESYKRAARAAVPIGRPGTPEDVAHAILLLASPFADYVNGATLAVDGGSGAGRFGVRPVGA